LDPERVRRNDVRQQRTGRMQRALLLIAVPCFMSMTSSPFEREPHA
jgi:hypothetical protein